MMQGRLSMWDDFPEGAHPEGWIELSENGWGAMAAWYAGPDNVRREPMGVRTGLVRVTCEKSDGTVSSWEEPITEDDVRGIEDDIDAYLKDAGLPQRPRGYRWFLRLPDGIRGEDDFWDRLNRADMALPRAARHPRDTVPVLGQVVQALYGRA
jgi:hypothetical protein